MRSVTMEGISYRFYDFKGNMLAELTGDGDAIRSMFSQVKSATRMEVVGNGELVYHSSTRGPVPVRDMDTAYLRNVVMKLWRERVVPKMASHHWSTSVPYAYDELMGTPGTVMGSRLYDADFALLYQALKLREADEAYDSDYPF